MRRCRTWVVAFTLALGITGLAAPQALADTERLRIDWQLLGPPDEDELATNWLDLAIVSDEHDPEWDMAYRSRIVGGGDLVNDRIPDTQGDSRGYGEPGSTITFTDLRSPSTRRFGYGVCNLPNSYGGDYSIRLEITYTDPGGAERTATHVLAPGKGMDLGSSGPNEPWGPFDYETAGQLGAVCAHSMGAFDTDPPPPVCDDGVDNDGDAMIDFPNDIGCSARDDDGEADDVSLSWRMADRYDGEDHNDDGLADSFTGTRSVKFSPWPVDSTSQVDPAFWEVHLEAGHPCRPVTNMAWVIDGLLIPDVDCSTTYHFRSSRAPTQHHVAFQINGVVKARAIVTPRDWLIVSLGDSYGSGEGVPDVPRGDGRASQWQDKQCHRTAEAATSRAAAHVENSDPHSSVTFLHLACSGATMAKGLLGKYGGAAPDARKRKKAPQLTELGQLLDGREPDAVLLSIGGNDIGFSSIIEGCLKEDDCPNDGAGKSFRKAIKKLPGRYRVLAACLTGTGGGTACPKRGLKLGLDPRRTFITQYPDATRHQSGKACGSRGTKQVLWDAPAAGSVVPYEIARDEATWASKVVSRRLNRAIARSARKAKWDTITSHVSAFSRHGYCAKDHWFVRWDEANQRQERPSKLKPAPGVLHPNRDGQKAYAKAILRVLKALGMPT